MNVIQEKQITIYLHNAIIALHNINSNLFHVLQNKIKLNMIRIVELMQHYELVTKLSNNVAHNFEYSVD